MLGMYGQNIAPILDIYVFIPIKCNDKKNGKFLKFLYVVALVCMMVKETAVHVITFIRASTP